MNCVIKNQATAPSVIIIHTPLRLYSYFLLVYNQSAGLARSEKIYIKARNYIP